MSVYRTIGPLVLFYANMPYQTLPYADSKLERKEKYLRGMVNVVISYVVKNMNMNIKTSHLIRLNESR